MAYQKTHCVLFYLFFLDSKKGEDNMRKFIVGRLLSIIPVLIIVSVVIFSVVHLTPGEMCIRDRGYPDPDTEIQPKERIGKVAYIE